MGNYIDSDDCAGSLRDDLGGLYTLPDEQVDLENDIAYAESLVDSYVGKRYEVPVSDATALSVLKPLALDLFAERAYARGSAPELTEKIKNAADRARQLLLDIAKGTVTLAGATGLTERPTGGADAITVEGNTPEFTHDDLKGY